MTASASNRLEQLQSEIDTMTASMEAMREEYAALVAAGDDDEADKVAAKVRDAEARRAILNDRLPVLVDLAEQEADEARSIEAERLTKEANAKQAELKGDIAKIAKLAEQLRRAVDGMEENAGLNWFLVAKKARELGGDPDRTQIDGFRQLFDNLELSKRRVVGIAEGYSQRVAQIGL
jgi:predicted transcriptional regulator